MRERTRKTDGTRSAGPFRRIELAALHIDDQRSFRHVALYERLKQVLLRSHCAFRVTLPGAPRCDWSRALFLNLTFWSPTDAADVLVDERIPADVVAHVAWHHLAARALGPSATSADGLLLGESVASAFDLYLLGRLLGHAPRSTFLRTQAAAMGDVAEGAGLTAADFGALLTAVAADPESAFSDLRELLFDAATLLVRAEGPDEAATILDTLASRRFYPLLHHYQLSNWILYARALAPSPDARLDAQVAKMNRALVRAPVALEWLERHWLEAAEKDPVAW